MKTAIVFGGCGTFGSLVARHLASLKVPTVIAGRDGARIERFAAELGAPHRAIVCDVTDAASCCETLKTCGGSDAVAVNCAGPFSHLGTALIDACLDAGSHYCDINDDRSYFKRVRERNGAFAARKLAAVCGCASLPAISGALAMRLRGTGAPPARARATLFIGNKNPKGFAAIHSAVESLHRPIAAPQGTIYGFQDGETIPVPRPFGPRKAYNFESPEYDLFSELLGVTSVSVKVGFEMRAANWVFNALAQLPAGLFGKRFATLMFWLGKCSPPMGCSGGAIVTELFWADGNQRVGSVSSPEHGQRMAVLPCVFAAYDLCSDAGTKWGAMTAYEFLGGDAMLSRIASEGFLVSA